METVSVLGCGWLGLPLAKHLVGLGYSVKGSATTNRHLDKLSSVGVKPFVIDIAKLTSGVLSFLRSHILIINIPVFNFVDYKNLLHQIEESSIEKLLFTSSTSVYPNINDVITEEEGVEFSDSPLVAIEKLFMSSAEISTTVIRFGGLIGYDRNPVNFFPSGKLVQNPLSNVNMIHRDDCVGLIEQIIVQGAWGEIFNCCADSHPTKREFYTKIANEQRLEPPHFEEPEKTEYKIISSKKVKNYLNYEFKHDDLLNLKEK